MFPDIMAQNVNMCLPMGVMLGYTLYFSGKICSIAEKYGITPYFHPKTTATFRAKIVESWKKMLYDFVDNTQEWLEQYHIRFVSESVNSMVEKKMPTNIRKKLSVRKKQTKS